MYRLFRRSLDISAFVSASVPPSVPPTVPPCVPPSVPPSVPPCVPPISVRLPCVCVSVGRVVFGGDGDEGLLEAEAGDFDLARPVARVEHRVEGGVGIAGLDLHHVVPDL